MSVNRLSDRFVCYCRIRRHGLARQDVVVAPRLPPLGEEHLRRRQQSEDRHRQDLLRLNEKRDAGRLILVQPERGGGQGAIRGQECRQKLREISRAKANRRGEIA